MRIRSRIIYPVTRPPLENGGLFVYNGKIAAVGDWDHINRIGTGEVVDLGEVITLPGLINAHCHLDYTNMAGRIPPPRNFPDWIKSILALKSAWSFSEYAQSWLQGATMLLQSGTTTVADIEAVPELIPDLWKETPLRIYSFLEMTGVKDDRNAAEILRETLERVLALPAGKNRAGLSPHALYSTKPELLRITAEASLAKGLRLTMHVAESREEMEMYGDRSGSLFSWLKNQRDMSDCGGNSPVQQLEKCGILSNRFLAVHVNHITHPEAQLLATRGCSVVHCPSSHAYFKHDPFPYETLKAVGVNVCLGTDSLASFTPRQKEPAHLNMFLEMQRFSEKFPTVPNEEIIRMATLYSASALGLAETVGALHEQAKADFISIPSTAELKDCPEAIVNHVARLSSSWISGLPVFGMKA